MRAMGFRCAALAVLCAALTAAPASAAPGSHPGHAGRWITDGRGRVLLLHGVNMVYKRSPYYPSVAGFGNDDARFLASEGYDAVRVGIIYKAVEPQPGVYDDAYLAQIAHTVRTLGRHGIWSLLDFHQDMYNERFQGEGWPDWAVQDDGLPAQPQAGFPGNYLAMPALERAFDHFWANSPGPGGVGLQDRYAAAWAHVAAYFRRTPWVLGYELLNEPWPGTPWIGCANTEGCPLFDAKLTEFVQRAVAAIRSVDPRTLVWYEPNAIFNGSADTQLGRIGDPEAVFAFHDYCLIAQGDSYPADACRISDDRVFANALKRSASSGDGLAMTEFGATNNTQLLEDMVDRADANLVPWFYWAYCGCDDPTTSGPGDVQAVVRDPSKAPKGPNLEAFKLNVLSRPYPKAVAGTPLGIRFDPGSKRFTLRYSTARVRARRRSRRAPTKVALPRRQYPKGYRAVVRGGSIRSRSGARTLRISSCRRAGKVRVVVKPGAGPSRDSC